MFTNSLILLAVLTCAYGAAISELQTSAHMREGWESSPVLKNLSPNKLRELRRVRQNVRENGCPVNLCFALQGDVFIRPGQFQRQKDFVELIVAITTTDENGNFCAVQYGQHNNPISPLTKRRFDFVEALQAAEKEGGSDTNISGALAYAGFQVRTQADNPRKIVLFGDGVDTLGAEPIRIARAIRDDGTGICAVAVGASKNLDDLAQITDDENLVLRINDFFELGEIVFGLVNQVCGYN